MLREKGRALLGDLRRYGPIALLALALGVNGNLLSDVLGRALGLEAGPIGAVLPVTLLSAIALAVGHGIANARLRSEPESWRQAEGFKDLLGNGGAAFSLVATLSLWCKEFVCADIPRETQFIDYTAALLIAFVPLFQGVMEGNMVFSKFENLYKAVHDKLEELAENSHCIRQRWVDRILKDSTTFRGMDDMTRWKFIGFKMQLWAYERDDVVLEAKPDGLRAEVQPPSSR
jgi:hypothetical protein